MIKRNRILKGWVLSLFVLGDLVGACDPRIVEGPNPWCQKIIEIVKGRKAIYEDKTVKIQEILDTSDPNVLKSLPEAQYFEDLVSLKIWASNAVDASKNNKLFYTGYLTFAGRLKSGEDDVSQAFEALLKDHFEYLFRRYQNAKKFLKGSYKGFVATFPLEDIQSYNPANQEVAQQCIDDFEARSRILKILYQHTSPEDYTRDTSKILAVAREFLKYLNAYDFETVIPDDTRWTQDLKGYLSLYYRAVKIPNFIAGEDDIRWLPKDRCEELFDQKVQKQQAFAPKDVKIVGIKNIKNQGGVSRQERRRADKANKKIYKKNKNFLDVEKETDTSEITRQDLIAFIKMQQQKALEAQEAKKLEEQERRRQEQERRTGLVALIKSKSIVDVEKEEEIASQAVASLSLTSRHFTSQDSKKEKTQGVADPDKAVNNPKYQREQERESAVLSEEAASFDLEDNRTVVKLHHSKYKLFEHFWVSKTMEFADFMTLFRYMGGQETFAGGGSSHIKLEFVHLWLDKTLVTGTWRPHDGTYGKFALETLREYFKQCGLTHEFIRLIKDF